MNIAGWCYHCHSFIIIIKEIWAGNPEIQYCSPQCNFTLCNGFDPVGADYFLWSSVNLLVYKSGKMKTIFITHKQTELNPHPHKPGIHDRNFCSWLDHIHATPALAESCIGENSSPCVEHVLTFCFRCLLKPLDIAQNIVGLFQSSLDSLDIFWCTNDYFPRGFHELCPFLKCSDSCFDSMSWRHRIIAIYL